MDTSCILALGLILYFHGSGFNISRILKIIHDSTFTYNGYYANEYSFNTQN